MVIARSNITALPVPAASSKYDRIEQIGRVCRAYDVEAAKNSIGTCIELRQVKTADLMRILGTTRMMCRNGCFRGMHPVDDRVQDLG